MTTEAKRQKQTDWILSLLKRGPVKESDVYPRVKRLAARIHDLREQGFRIKTAKKEPVAVYELEEAA